jgi:pyridoxamine 5'-phosphate oxidase family protein
MGIFTEAELSYLKAQFLGRIATVKPDGTLQNSPVSFAVDPDTGTVEVGGQAMRTSRKFANVRSNPQVAFVVDDVASVDPWVARGVEVRGTAEALEDVAEPLRPRFGRDVIRIRPRRIISWGVEPGRSEYSKPFARDV